MKRKDWKRTAAFVTSVAMATSMMPVELGGVLVHAIDSAIVSDANGGSALTKDTFEVGDYFEDNALFNLPTGGDTIKVKIGAVGEEVEVTSIKYVKAEYTNEKTKTVKAGLYLNPAKIDTLETDNPAEPDIELFDETNFVDFIYIDDVKKPGDDGYGETFTTITLNSKELAPTYSVSYATANDVIKSINFTSADGKSNNLDASVVGATAFVNAKAKTQVTITSSALLAENNGKDLTPYMTGEPGNYVYTFNALDNFTLVKNLKTIDVKDAEFYKFNSEGAPSGDGNLDSKIGILEYNGKEVAAANKLADIAPLPAGAEVTIVANNMFRIPDGAIKSVKANHTLETEDVVSTYSQGKWTATFCLADTANLYFIKHDHKLTYNLTNKVNELLATCGDGDLTNEIAAKIWTEIDNRTETNPKADPTEIANNGTIHYDDEATLNFTWNKDLLGTSGQNDLQTEDMELRAKAVLKKGNDEYTIRVYKAEADGANAGNNKVTVTGKTVVNGQVTNIPDLPDAQYINGDGANWDAGESVLKDILAITPSSIKVDKKYVATAGSFETTLTVWETDVTAAAKVLKYNFKTEPSDQIKASDIKVYAAYTGTLSQNVDVLVNNKLPNDFNYGDYKNGFEVIENKTIADYVKYVEVTKKAYEAGKANAKDYTDAVDSLHTQVKNSNDRLNCTKNANGVWEIPTVADVLETKHTVTTVFEVENSKNIAANAATVPAGDAPEIFDQDFDFTLSGSSFSSTIDPSTPHAMNVSIINPNYKDETFKVQWKLVTPKVESGIYFVDCQNGSATKNVKVGNDFAETIKAYLNKQGDAEIDLTKADYWYTTKEPTANIDIDDISEGLPTDLVADDTVDDYYIWASVDGYETPHYLHVHAVANVGEAGNAKVIANLKNSTFTYGDQIKAEDLYFTANGTTVNNAVAANIKFDVYPYDSTNGTYKGTPLNIDGAVNIDKLAPGQYLLKPKGITFANAGAYEADETTGLAITINKKQLTTDMVDVIIKEIGNASSVSVTNADVTAKAAGRGVNNTNIELKLTGGGTNTANKVNTYSVEVRAADTFLPNEYGIGAQQGKVKYSDVYAGTLDVNWYVVKNMESTNIHFKNDSTKANIYKDDKYGVQLHIEAFMADVDGEYSNSTAASGAITKENKKPTVKYGFVYDKSNKFAKDATEADVEKALRIDNGCSSTNGVVKNSDGLVTGLNSIVKSVDDYIWVRPYAIVDGGAPVYGKAKCYDFKSVAQASVNPEIKEVSFVQKKVNDKVSPYYYIYATKADRVDSDNKRTAEPDRWGVVVSREKNYTDLEIVNEDAKAFDYNSLTLDHCDAHSEAKKSNNYNEYEVGTLVKVTDSLSRVYVRTYADYGNGLVVYNDLPAKKTNGGDFTNGYYDEKLAEVSCDSASAKLSDILGLDTGITGTTKMTLFRNKKVEGDVANESRTTKAGKVQKFESFNTDELAALITDTGLVIDNKKVYDSKKHNLILGEGFNEKAHKTGKLVLNVGDVNGAGTNAGKFAFTAVTSVTDVSFRGYVVYNGITVYTGVKTNIAEP